jgi:beta-mannosidase
LKTISLNGDWQVAEAGSDDWIPATVPGCVHTDLMAVDRIPDPFVRLNEQDVQWVSDREWHFRRTFAVDEAFTAHDRVELTCHGLDTFATLLLNGEEFGKTENAFHEHTFDVTGRLRAGENTLEVRFTPSDRVAQERMERDGELPSNFFQPRPYVRKPQYATSWDWGPRLSSCGLWRDVELRAFSSARIDVADAPAWVVGDRGEVELTLTLARTDDEPLTVNAAIFDDTSEVAHGEVHDVGVRCKLSLTVQSPRLWWPVGLGEQAMYDLSIRVRQGDRALDQRLIRFGFRTVEIEREPDALGESFIFLINRRRVFCKGFNWIPADSFPARVPSERYRGLLEMARDQNANMIRIWGGGIYEADVFYELCNELGLMVWQDFMFACAEYPDAAWFHDLVRREARCVVRRLRRHPSLVLWCGNNENHMGHDHWGWPEKFHAKPIYEDILPEICGELAPNTPYWPGSPFGGEKSNCETHGDHHHWGVWHGSRDYDGYLKCHARFISEFGFQAFPTDETVAAFAEPEDLRLDSEVMLHHQRTSEGNEKLQETIDLFVPQPADFDGLMLTTQINQAEALRTGIEHWRRLKWHTSGALIWQLNDCWPVISWSTVDYFLRPKPAYYAVRRSFAPVLITAHREEDDVVLFGINDTEQPVSGELDVELFDLSGEANRLQTNPIELKPDSSNELCRIALGDLDRLDRRRQFLWITFYSGAHTTFSTVLFERLKDVELTTPEISIETETDQYDGERTVRITANTFVKGAWLSVPGANVRFSDNALDLVPYVSRDVTVLVLDGPPVGDLKTALRVQYLNPM